MPWYLLAGIIELRANERTVFNKKGEE